MTILQTAVHNIPELRMVETMEEFISLSSTTPGPSMGYDNYLTLLQNACISMIAISNLGHLQPLELPTNMTCLLTILTTSIPRITPPQTPHMVALTCQQRNSTRSILPTSIGLLMSPPLPLEAYQCTSSWQTQPQKVSWTHLPSCQHIQTSE